MTMATVATSVHSKPPTPAPVSTVASDRRRVFHVKLSTTECTEVSYRDLERAWERANGISPTGVAVTVHEDPLHDRTATADASVGPVPLPTPRTQRFDIIEHLEKRYGGGAVVGPSLKTTTGDGDDDDDAADGDNDGYRRGDDDDLYDSEDSFIDDEELQQNIEEIHTQARVQTKHSGFFVNAGSKIETVPSTAAGDDDDDDDGDVEKLAAPTKKAKGTKKATAESSRAVKAFLDDWSEAASDWQPGADILEAMEALRRAVRELTETTPFTKVFPRQLDDALRAVDVLVVEAHPNKWRVNGYFATLMAFLPFTKQYLKSNMLRLEARDTARAAKDEMEKIITTMAIEIKQYATQAESRPADAVKEDILQDKDLSSQLHRLLVVQDEWIAKENDYRQMLKTEDKKHMKEQDYAQLNSRQERNRVFNRVLAFFPTGLMDLQSLRGMSKPTKTKTTRKPAVSTKATAPVKSPATTPKRNLPVAVVAETPVASSTPAKRSIKPFKSRMMDELPPFSEKDFDEIL